MEQLLYLALFISSCLPTRAHEDHEAAASRGTRSLDVYADGKTIHLLTAQQENDTPTLFYQRSEDSGTTWSAPVQVDRGMPSAKTPRRGDDPQIGAAGDHLIAAWMTAGDGYAGSGPMATALSEDGGKTWRAGPNPADDHSTRGHAYIDIAADEHGRFHLVWLDGRDGKQALRYARSDNAGEHWTKNATLDAETCECCWNTLLTASNNRLWVLYRDKNPRDMAVAISEDGGESWKRTGAVGAFRWEFPNCPEAGGGLAVTTPPTGLETLHALVRTGKEGVAGIHYQNSTDGGSRWSSPRNLAPGVADHPALASDAAGNMVATWDALEGDDLVVKASISHDNGTTWTPARRLSAAGVNASHPRAVVTSNGLRVFWTYAPSKGGMAGWASAPTE